ncbi:TonB-dependent receptor [Sphingomonas sp. S1-29]|uniref:TonB-dependent receptor plug domain-containing protein n=1 Tax=Sphingomonas sp. S1-29 TaxID=2991074 RepID=UPI002240619F|nr:TonB-dependent receptor [Sphingomonas sp. S1-29]UZK70102.1 TonB-dependent receptor [Sphingomonas sp. S1-29]
MKSISSISIVALATSLCAGVAHGQAQTPPVEESSVVDPPAAANAQGEIIVTGTRRTDRTVLESAAPVDVFTAETLQTQASGDMNNILRNLVPSFNVGRFAISDGSTFVRPPTLRGLPPDQILVLVNGKRRHRAALVQIGGGALAAGSQGVDLAQIPTIAVERIEVLRDGAAAQYGSDAIAGVINYGLKRNREGIELTARYGQFYEGDGENVQIAANVGLPLTDAGFFNVSGEYIDSKQTSRGVQRPGVVALQAQFPGTYDGLRDPVQIFGDPQVEAARLFVNAGLEVAEGTEVYAFGNYGVSRQEGDFNYRQPVSSTGRNAAGTGNQTFGAAGGIFTTLFTDAIPGQFDARGRPVYSATGRTFNFNSLYPIGFAPRFFGKVTDYSIVGGLKGEVLTGLSYDVSASYGQNQIDYRMTNTLNPSMGPASPTAFYMGSLQQRETNFNADFAYETDIGLASPLTIAAGAEHRREAYAILLGDPASYAFGNFGLQTVQRADGTRFVNTAQQVGSNGFPGYGPDSTIDQDRTSYAFYAEVEADIVAGLSLSGAIRHEEFSDFGSTTNWKATGRYEFTPAFAVRGAASTGFRAPTPGQLFTTNVATAFTGANPIESAILPVTTAAAQVFGATSLRPEKSKNYSAGIVITPTSSFSITLDAYQIEVTDRIGLTGNIEIDTAARRQALRDAGVQNAETLGRLRYFTNSFDTRTQGVDLVANHTASTDFGRFNTILAVNYNDTEVTGIDTVNLLGTQTAVIDAVRVGNIENLNSKWRGNLTENWSLDRLSVTARASYWGKFTSYAATADGGNLTFGDDVTFDLEVGFELNDQIRLAVGGENIFDNYPDKNFRATGQANQNWYAATGGTVSGSVYPDDAPYGFNGGFWYFRAATKF